MSVKIIRVGDGSLPAFSSGAEFLSGALPQPPRVGLRHSELIDLICKGYNEIYGSTVNLNNSQPISLDENAAPVAGVPKQASIKFPLSEKNLNETIKLMDRVANQAIESPEKRALHNNFPTDRGQDSSRISPQGKTFTSGTDLYRTGENFTGSTIRVSNARTVREITTRDVAAYATEFLADLIAKRNSGKKNGGDASIVH